MVTLLKLLQESNNLDRKAFLMVKIMMMQTEDKPIRMHRILCLKNFFAPAALCTDAVFTQL